MMRPFMISFPESESADFLVSPIDAGGKKSMANIVLATKSRGFFVRQTVKDLSVWVCCILALSGCAIFNVNESAQPSLALEGSTKPNTFEVFFDPDRSDISQTASQIIQSVADSAKHGGGNSITLSVHSTTAGWDDHSQDLSERRAAMIKAELVKDGVPAAEITTVDIGRTPVVPTTDGVREPQNRRTEIILR
jgi:hypothetical protein